MNSRHRIRITAFKFRENSPDGEKKWTMRQKIQILSVKNGYTVKNALVGWFILFMAFGPLEYYFYNFAGYSLYFTLFQGIFVASLSQSILFTYHRFRSPKIKTSSPVDISVEK